MTELCAQYNVVHTWTNQSTYQVEQNNVAKNDLKWPFKSTYPQLFLKTTVPNSWTCGKNLKSKISWEVPYSVNFSKCISNDFQFYLKTAIGRCLWLFEFKNWLVIPISATGFDFFSLRIWYSESTFIFSINACTTHFSSIWKLEIPKVRLPCQALNYHTVL